MSVFKMDGILPPLMSTDEQVGSADFEQFLDAVYREYDRLLIAEGFWVVNKIFYSTREDASVARRYVAEQNVKARLAAR